MRLLLTRDKEGNAHWAAACQKVGISAYCLETISMQTVPTLPVDLTMFDQILLTSATAARALRQLVPKNASLPAVAVVGQGTARAAKQAGLAITFISPTPTAEALARTLPLEKGHKIVWLRSNIASLAPLQILRHRGGEVTEVSIYTTRILSEPDAHLARLLEAGRIDAIVLASPSAVRGLLARVPMVPKHILVITIGPKTAAAARGAGFERIQIASRPSISGVVDAIL